VTLFVVGDQPIRRFQDRFQSCAKRRMCRTSAPRQP
jgi:hypothetical protein